MSLNSSSAVVWSLAGFRLGKLGKKTQTSTIACSVSRLLRPPSSCAERTYMHNDGIVVFRIALCLFYSAHREIRWSRDNHWQCFIRKACRKGCSILLYVIQKAAVTLHNPFPIIKDLLILIKIRALQWRNLGDSLNLELPETAWNLIKTN